MKKSKQIRTIKLKDDALINMTKLGAEITLMCMNDIIKFNLSGINFTIWRMVEK